MYYWTDFRIHEVLRVTALWALVYLSANHQSEFIIESLKSMTLTNSETEKSQKSRQMVNGKHKCPFYQTILISYYYYFGLHQVAKIKYVHWKCLI